MKTNTFDYNQLTPGIRKVVRWLHDNGFTTCDSGDGVTHHESRMECAWDEPMVAMEVTRQTMLVEADRLYGLLQQKGLTGQDSPVHVEASYVPGEEDQFLVLSGLDDLLFGGH